MNADLQTSPNKIYDAVTLEFTAAGQDFTNKQGLRAQIMTVPFKVVVYLATVYFPGDDWWFEGDKLWEIYISSRLSTISDLMFEMSAS